MADFGTMQARIADEMARDDLAEPIRQAVKDAVLYYQNEPYFIGRLVVGGIVTSGVATAPLPTDWIAIDRVEIAVNGKFVELPEASFDTVLALEQAYAPGGGVPQCYAPYNETIYMAPTPNLNTFSRFLYRKALPPPDLDADGASTASASYFWMNTAERMIRTYAKGLLYQDLLKDPQSAQSEFAESMKAFDMVLQRTSEALLPREITPWDG